MSNRFYFPDDDDDSSASSTDLASLPYPKPLTRAAFLTPDFDPTTFLSSLHNRFQTLEDLRSELRQRSSDLNKELLDLVNSNYEDFLGLGRDLRGGDEKVEEIKLGVLGFRREVEGLRDKVKGKREEVERLVEKKKRIRKQIVLGRGLLEVERSIGELEGRLMLVQNGVKYAEVDNVQSEGESEDEVDEGDGVGKLRRHAEQYVYITKLVRRLGSKHPFLVNQEERILRLKQTVLLDLASALKQTRGPDVNAASGVLRILETYHSMNASGDAIKVLKEIKTHKP